QPRMQAAPRPTQPIRSAGNSRYLPPMPEMLKNRTPSHALPTLADRGPQNSSRTPSPSAEGRPHDRPVIRAQDGGDPAAGRNAEPPILPAKLRLPSPEELGLLSETSESRPSPATSKNTGPTADWATTRQRLESWGALHYRLERAEQGWRFVCVLPHPTRQDAQHHIEVEAPSDEAAMLAVLERAEAWLRSQQ
ncbi:MAG: hypothetical protein NZM42_14790, partial [Gemmatales bacterium]|nr:hypothetical protein [Gemmatales bacterium]